MSALTFLVAAASVVAGHSSPLLPLPQSESLGEGTLTLASGFTFKIQESHANSTLLTAASLRYRGLISSPSEASGELSSCSISSTNIEEGDILGSDESFKLSISESGECSISGETVWG